MMLQCENCHGTDLAARGIGTQKVERELRRKLKDMLETTNFVRIDSDSNASPLFDTTKSNIIIGTEAALAFIDWARISCTLLLDPDTLLFIPEYKIAERLWQTIRSVAYASPAAARTLVQTKHPEHEAFRNQTNPERFYVKELQQRKFFGYPPFNFILKLSYGSTQKQLAEQEAKRLFISLTTDFFEALCVMSNGLLDDAAKIATLMLVVMHASFTEIAKHGGKDRWRDGEVCDSHGILPTFFRGAKLLCKVLEIRDVRIVPGVVCHVRREFLQYPFIHFPHFRANCVDELRAKCFIVHRGPRKY
jgi:hypothetical protein